MRIIAGDYKGRRLTTPNDKHVRPTTDKVKEAIFSIVSPYIDEAVVIDLFSGTGNLGLEALSRGAERCYFCDNNRNSIALVKENVAHCNAEAYSVIICADYESALGRIKEKADIILLDPPYKKGMLEPCIERIRSLDLLSEEGVIVAEHGMDEPLSDQIAGFIKIKERRYGTILITIFH